MQHRRKSIYPEQRQKAMPTEVVSRWLLNSLREPIEEYKPMLLSDCPTMDWDGFVACTYAHGLTPLVYHQLQGDAELWAAVPPSIQARLEEGYLDNARRNLQLYSQLIRLMTKLNQGNIPAIVLKGAYLAHVVYRDRALRPMVDIDILVRPTNVAYVERVLQEQGYILSDWQHHDWCLKHHYHLPYIHAELGLNVELHWDIQRPRGPYRVDLDELWSQARPFGLVGVQALGLSPEHLLLYQCLHIAKHGFGVGIRPLYDLAAILKCYQGQIDWQKVQCMAEQWRMQKALKLSLYFADEFFGSMQGPSMEMLGATAVDPEVLETAREQILTVGINTGRLSSEFVHLWHGTRESSKASQLLRRILLPPDLMASIYHLPPDSWHVYLYYPVRLYDLFVRYPRIIRQLMRHEPAAITWAQQTNKVDALREWLVT